MENSFSILAASSAAIVLLAFYFNVYARDLDLAELHRQVGPESNVSTGVMRKDWGGIDAGFARSLRSLGEPLVLQNTVAAHFPRLSLADVSQMLGPESEISSVFKHVSPVFGPYYDASRPMHQLPSVRGRPPYDEHARLRVRDVEAAFSAGGPPFYHLSVRPEELGIPLFNISELISLHPQKSSVNLWLGMKGGTTPCHYDGYHNMYVQLSGQKRFILYPPQRMAELSVFPFLHPSYGQCGASPGNLSWASRDWREVTLRAGELLYIPPFWLHEVIGQSPSVAYNVWTGIDDEDIFQQILSVPIPGLDFEYDIAQDESATAEPPFRPHFPLLQREMGALPTRLVLGAFLVFEVIHRIDNKHLLGETLADVYARYKPLIAAGVLEGAPAVVRQSLERTIDQWLPKPPVFSPAVWGMSIANKETSAALTQYTFEVSTLMKTLSPATVRVWAANYVEAVAMRVGGVQRASWLVDIVGRKNEAEEARRRGPI